MAEMLGIITHSFNAVENSSTGVSPYFATFGANPRSTLAQLLYEFNKIRPAEGVEMLWNLSSDNTMHDTVSNGNYKTLWQVR